MIKIFVGNVPYAAKESDLEELFKKHGTVISVEIIRDRGTGKSKGFGFVEMENKAEGEQAIEKLNEQEELKGRLLKVETARPKVNRQEQHSRDQQRHTRSRQQQNRPPERTQSTDDKHDYFHNPYTFIPTPSRQDAKGFAGDFNPLDCGLHHASLNKDLWTGHIPIKITTVTPLVLLKDDGRERKPSDPQVYDVHSRIPEPSLRGMLRSAYEVVTNSRYSSFRNNDRLAYRMPPGEATKFIPTIIKKDKKTDTLKAYFYTGSSHPTTNDGPLKVKKENGKTLSLEAVKKGVMYAALLSQYNKSKITYPDGTEPKTRDKVYAELVLCGSGSIRYWQTSRIWLKSNVSTKPEIGRIPSTWDTQKLYRDSTGKCIIQVVEGTVLITNQNIDKKGNERIFFIENSNSLQSKEIEDHHINNWKALIKNYRDAHTDDDIFNRKHKNKHKEPWEVFIIGKDNRNKPIYDYAWSPHLYHKGNRKDRWGRDVQDALDLKDGTMAYARCQINDKTGKITKIKDLFPVMISRELYDNTPEDLLDPSLRPATELDQLSPADRLFGWTPQGQGSDGGYKSRIRVICEDGEQPDILDSFEDDPLPLSILGQPKPEQGRFYVAADDKGTPQEGIDKRKAGYDLKDNKKLRGRKYYWHHKGLENDTEEGKNHWNPKKNQDQEYIRKGKTKDTQNRSIKGWIKPGEVFKASLYVQNLEPKEVGALLWLFTLNKDLKDNEDKRYFRLGYGKPLGFGSVKIEIDTDKSGKLRLGNQDNWKEYYAKLNDIPPAKLDGDKQKEFIDQFTESMLKAYQQPKEEESETEDTAGVEEFDRLPFIQGFLRVLQGPNDQYPIHYPRKKSERDPKGKNFEWFVQNERGKKRALPDVNDENGLPYKL